MTIRDDVSSKIHQIHHFQLTKPLAPNFSQKDCAKALLSLITGLTVTLQPEEAKERTDGCPLWHRKRDDRCIHDSVHHYPTSGIRG